FQHRLCGWPAVDVYDQRNLAARWRVCRKQESSIKRRAVLCLEFQKLRSPQSVFRDFIARLPHRNTSPAYRAQRHAWRGRRPYECLLVVLSIVRKFSRVNSFIVRELLHSSSIQLDSNKLALPRIVFVGRKEHPTGGLI